MDVRAVRDLSTLWRWAWLRYSAVAHTLLGPHQALCNLIPHTFVQPLVM